MSDKIIPSKIKSLLYLIRLDKPIGFTLLMWPCWFGLAILPINQLYNLKWYFFFMLGSFLMRSAGCIINDIIDINIDKKIDRTSKRPLVEKSVSVIEALVFLSFLLLLSLLILLQFNNKTILFGLFSIPLIILYPYAKRFTYWPQFFLGIAFNWGVLITSMQFYGYITQYSIILYIGCIIWTLGYDTIYAYQDKEDDIKYNIKSTAVLFGNKGKFFVLLCYCTFLIILGSIALKNSGTINSIFVLIPFLIAMIFFLNKWNIKSKKSSNFYFKLNNFFGLICFVYLIIF